MIFKAFDVVTVPFPFTDRAQRKKRPALVLSNHHSFNGPVGHSIMAMITSAKNQAWPWDVKISELKKAGLAAESVVRMKLFTLDHRFVLDKIGSLGGADRSRVTAALMKVLSEVLS